MQYGSRPGTTRGSSSTAAGIWWRERLTLQRISPTCSRRSIHGDLGRVVSRSVARRRRRRVRRRLRSGSRQRGVRRARRRASSAVTTTARSSSGAASSRRGADRRRGGERDRQARRPLAIHAGPAPRSRRRVGRAAVHDLDDRSIERRRRRPGSFARLPEGACAWAAVRRGGPRGGEAPLPLPGVPARVSVFERGFELDLEEPAFAVAPGQTAVLYEGDVVVGAGVVSTATRVLAA